MKLARYWTRESAEATGREGPIRVVSRGWSNQSLEHAATVARDLARRVAERLASGMSPEARYQYGDRPLPEPVIREFQGPAAGVVTRNMYGALVLNTDDLMFIDIDREPRHATNEIQQVAERNGVAARIYKTAAGYRVMISNVAILPGSSQSETLLQQFQSDSLYVRLCRAQQSFRARLTPKPWRVGMHTPPVSFPFETPSDQAKFNHWVARYDAASDRYATCHYVAQAGTRGIAPQFYDLIEFHDQQTKANSGLPLA
ncbi:MAG TPA: hypothetical protein VKU01_20445 [Bryobacteraceae bacterium]|nr:hypothetical protein [Bryobacteraceae bacterium]